MPEAGSLISCVCQLPEAVTGNATRFWGTKSFCSEVRQAMAAWPVAEVLSASFTVTGPITLNWLRVRKAAFVGGPFSLVTCNAPSLTVSVPLRACQPCESDEAAWPLGLAPVFATGFPSR